MLLGLNQRSVFHPRALVTLGQLLRIREQTVRWSPFHSRFDLPHPCIAIVSMLVIHTVADTVLMYWMPRALSSSFSSQPVAPGFVMSGFAAAYIVSRMILGLIPEKRFQKTLVMLPGLAGGGVLILALLTQDYLFTSIGYVVGGFLWSAEFPALMHLLSQAYPKRFGSSVGLHLFIHSVVVFALNNIMGILVPNITASNLSLV